MFLTDAERQYLASQRLGRLATVAADGTPQNNPVAFFVNAELGTIDIGGYRIGQTRKFRNVLANPKVAFVVDDLASLNPWRVRGVELRGDAEALVDVEPPMPNFSRELIRIHPRRILSWGIDATEPLMRARTVTPG
jgi:pyridoxamine 5'-phosphate oxidase family protein